ncbi:hypothetical protein [Nocardioides sp.]|uniref:hypothetical protein n=1 Tax=Nocardioides sp. TaxID=35761 RepID=UPI0039E6B294
MSTDEPTPPPAPDYGSQTPPPPPPPPGGGYGAPPPSGGYGAPPTGPGGYSVGDALSYGWKKFQENLGPILLVSLILIVGTVVASLIGLFIQGAITPDPSVTVREDGTVTSSAGGGVLITLISTGVSSALQFLASTVLGAIVIRGALDLTEGRSLDIGSIFSRLDFGGLIVLGLLNAVIVGIGFVLCVIPGIIAMFMLYYSTYFLIDKGLPPVESLKASFNMVKDNLGQALVWAIVALIVTYVGLCLCGVGILATAPIAIIGTAYTYKKLTGQAVAA